MKLSGHSNSPLLRLLRLFNVAAFLRWWGQGLLLCLPASVRTRFIPTPEKLIIEVQNNELLVSQEKGKVTREIGRFPMQALRDGSLRGQLPKTKEKHQNKHH